MRRRRVYFDTQIYGQVGNGIIDIDQLKSAIRTINCVCVLSPVTLLELLEDLVGAQGNDNQFRRRQLAIKAAWETTKHRICELPAHFARKVVFRVPEPLVRFVPADLIKWIGVATVAHNWEQLVKGQVPWKHTVHDRKTFGLAPDILRGQLDKGRDLYVNSILDFVLEIKPDYMDLRDRGAKSILTRSELVHLRRVLQGEDWRRNFVEGMKRRLRLQNAPKALRLSCDDVINAFHAVFAFQTWLLEQVLASNYKFDEDNRSYCDYMQLYYLCDPDFVFVSDDRPLHQHISTSSQAERVMTFEKFSGEKPAPS